MWRDAHAISIGRVLLLLGLVRAWFQGPLLDWKKLGVISGCWRLAVKASLWCQGEWYLFWLILPAAAARMPLEELAWIRYGSSFAAISSGRFGHHCHQHFIGEQEFAVPTCMTCVFLLYLSPGGPCAGLMVAEHFETLPLSQVQCVTVMGGGSIFEPVCWFLQAKVSEKTKGSHEEICSLWL